MKSIIITGGAGFIGSHVVRLFVNKYPDYRIINVDKLTDAGNLANLKDIEDKPNYRFVRADICDFDTIYALMLSTWLQRVMSIVPSKIRSLSPAPMSWVRSPCCRQPNCTGRACRKNGKASVSTISRPMRSMVRFR